MRILPRKRSLALLFGLALLLPGCSATTSGGSGEGGVRRATNRISAEELAAVSDLDAWSAISRLRPSWLRQGTRGASPALIVDGTPESGGLETLRSFRTTDLTMLELMSAADATTRYGTGYTSGAIVVTTKRR